MRNSKELSASGYEQLQSHKLYGKEKNSLAYVIGIMNIILHGSEAPNIIHTNTQTHLAKTLLTYTHTPELT